MKLYHGAKKKQFMSTDIAFSRHMMKIGWISLSQAVPEKSLGRLMIL